MRKTFKMLAAAAMLTAMIPLGAYAAPGTDGTQAAQDSARLKARNEVHHHLPSLGFRGAFGQDLLDLLKLDHETLRAKLAEGKTLAQIAEEQGVSRDELKKALTDSYNRKLEEQKARFAENLDKLLDTAQPQRGPWGKGRPEGATIDKGGFGARVHFNFSSNLDEAAELLGVTGEELKQALREGKSLADLAQEKGVDVQKLIDLHVNAWTQKIDQALNDGKITQEQAEKLKADAVNIATHLVNAKGWPGRPGIMPGKMIPPIKRWDGGKALKQISPNQQQQASQTK